MRTRFIGGAPWGFGRGMLTEKVRSVVRHPEGSAIQTALADRPCGRPIGVSSGLFDGHPSNHYYVGMSVNIGIMANLMKIVSLREANKDFSKLIQEIERRGEVFVITRHGRPVARLGPEAVNKHDDPDWALAFDEMKRLHAQGLDLGGLRPDRDDLYDRV